MNFSQDSVTKDLARGALIIFLGMFVSYFLKFIYRIVVSRYVGPENYGLLSLGDMVMNIGYLLALIGLDVGLISHLAFFKEKRDLARLRGSFWGNVIVSGLLSIVIVALLIIFSKYIAIGLFKNEALIPVLIVFALCIPFFSLMRIFSQAMLAFKKQQYDFLARTLGRDFLSFILAIGVIIMGGSILEISISYLITLIIGSIFSYYLLEKKVFPFFREKSRPIYEFKERIWFALPLFFSGTFLTVMQWLDTFFLGILTTTRDVGIYNVALPLAFGMGIFISTFIPIFYPIISGMIAKQQEKEVHLVYYTMTRWMFMLSFPILLLIVVFPENIIYIFFGQEFVEGSTALVILALTYFINIIVGLTFETLVCFKKTKAIFWLNAGSVISNIILNLLLIPHWGIIGAALATGISIVFREIIAFTIVKRLIHLPLRLRIYLKIMLAAGGSLAIATFPLQYLKIKGVPLFILTIGCFVFFYWGFLYLLKAISREDLLILNAVKNRVTLSVKNFKTMMRK